MDERSNNTTYYKGYEQGCGSEVAILSTASASTPISSALPLLLPTEPGLYLIYELADKHDNQIQQLTIYKGTLLVKRIT